VYEKKSSEMLMKKYREGVIFVCSICGRKFRVHERTNRKICTECLSDSAYGRLLIRHRKEIKEEVVED
jgi:DNA-directed RNA polymerase subunit RPC12/RpoP